MTRNPVSYIIELQDRAARIKLPNTQSALRNWAASHLKLDCIPTTLHQQALDSFCKRDVVGFLGYARSQDRTALVFDNICELISCGMYEESLFDAYVSTKGNLRSWDTLTLDIMFNAGKQQALQRLGDSLPLESAVVYRGVWGTGRKRRVRGFSWTTSLDVACWFASNVMYGGASVPKNAAVYRARIEPEEIYFVTNERNEHEVVGRPRNPRNLNLTTDQLIDGRDRHVAQKKQRLSALLDRYPSGRC